MRLAGGSGQRSSAGVIRGLGWPSLSRRCHSAGTWASGLLVARSMSSRTCPVARSMSSRTQHVQQADRQAAGHHAEDGGPESRMCSWFCCYTRCFLSAGPPPPCPYTPLGMPCSEFHDPVNLCARHTAKRLRRKQSLRHNPVTGVAADVLIRKYLDLIPLCLSAASRATAARGTQSRGPRPFVPVSAVIAAETRNKSSRPGRSGA